MMFIDDRNEAPKAGEADQGFESAEGVKKLSHADRVETAKADFYELAEAAEVQSLKDLAAEKPVGDLEKEQFEPIEGSRDNEV